MDIALAVSLGVLRLKNVHAVVLLSRNGSVFKHSTHSGIAVDIGVLTLDVAVLSGTECKLVEYAHEVGFHLS